MPKNAHAHFILGLMYQRMGQPQKVAFAIHLILLFWFKGTYFIYCTDSKEFIQAVLSYEKAAEILLRCEEEIDRPELLALVQIHHAQVH